MQAQTPQRITPEWVRQNGPMNQDRIEVWLVKGDAMRRLHGQRPSEVPPGHADEILVSLQPVENGQVIAWAPIFRRWMKPEETKQILEALAAEGWTAFPRRPTTGELALNTAERIEMAREKDRTRKRISRAWNSMRRAV